VETWLQTAFDQRIGISASPRVNSLSLPLVQKKPVTLRARDLLNDRLAAIDHSENLLDLTASVPRVVDRFQCDRQQVFLSNSELVADPHRD